MNENRIDVKNALAGFVKRNDSVLKKLGMLEKKYRRRGIYKRVCVYCDVFTKIYCIW